MDYIRDFFSQCVIASSHFASFQYMEGNALMNTKTLHLPDPCLCTCATVIVFVIVLAVLDPWSCALSVPSSLLLVMVLFVRFS